MITNNSVRKVLLLPESSNEFKVDCVDSLGIHRCSVLMFINRPGVDLQELDSISIGCVYLIDNSYYGEFYSSNNDFIRVTNPKFEFCLLVEHFHLKSFFQLYREDSIGKNCKFDQGTIIGGTDFSPVQGDNGELIQFPQMGGVKIGDNVVIKYNTMVGKGTFRYTEIGDNTMIDFGCQIGHNCIIGKYCIIAAGTIIGGSTKVGDNTVIGIGAKIRNGLTIGKNVSIGMGSVVIHDVPDNTVVVGNPAREIEHKRIFDKGGLV